MKRKIVVTGGTGRVGQALLNSANFRNCEIHALVRNKQKIPHLLRERADLVFHEIEDLQTVYIPDLVSIFHNAASVIHLAAAISESATVNESATVSMARNIAEAIKIAEVKNVVLLSSIAARSAEQQAINARPYGHRKLAAEQCFTQNQQSKHSIVTLRPPAVYGPNMGGTLELLTTLIEKKIPLPLGLALEKRDYIYIYNLVDLIWQIVDRQITDPNIPGVRTYEPCDGKALSTKELSEQIASALRRRPLLLPVPIFLLAAGAKILGKSELFDGAFGQMIATGNAALLNDFEWQPQKQVPASLEYLKG